MQEKRAVIANEQCQVVVSTQAGEVHHYLDKQAKIDYAWCGNPGFWANRNPVLFPILSGAPDGKYEYDGHTYRIGNHGPLRYEMFDLVECHEDRVVMEKLDNAVTQAAYPFAFRLQATYTLKGKKLALDYVLTNRDAKDMPFEFGFHPAFNCPFTADFGFVDYKIKFEQQEDIVSSNGFVAMKGSDVLDMADTSLFDRSLSFFFTGFKSRYVELTDGAHTLRVGTEGFDELGFWHKSPSTPFICIEPWRPRLALKTIDFFGPGHKAYVLPAGASVSFGYYFDITK